MAIYKIYEPCVIDAQLIKADPVIGREIVVSDDHVPSITWEAVDESAKRAMEKYQASRRVKQQAEFILNPERIREKFMQEYYNSLKIGAIDGELSSYEDGYGKEQLEERANEIASRKRIKKESVPSIDTQTADDTATSNDTVTK